jgi:hypothetical protein
VASPDGNAIVRRPEFEWLARVGLVARGVSYAVIGVLALKLAVGLGGKTTDQQGALKTIAQQPFGRTLLIALAVGLACYAAWRLLRAAIGRGTQQHDSAGDRIAGVVAGIGYGALAVTAVKIVAGAGSGSSSNPKQATGGVLDWPAGRVIVAVVGLILIGVALQQGYMGLSRKFLEDSKTEEMSQAVKRGFTALGVLGHLARTVVFGLVGYGLIKAAIDYNPRQAIGLDGALVELSRNSYGPVLLGVVAAGFIAFALYSMADARYRRI